MNIIKVKDYNELSKLASEMIIKQVNEKSNSVLGLATGNTPVGVYNELIKAYQLKKVSFKDVRTFNLDEYINVSNKQSYHTFMYSVLFSQIDIDIFKTNFPNEQKLDSYEELIDNLGIDLQILGIGVNGHIGFNEPNTKFDTTTHVVELSETTRNSNKIFFDDISEVPTHAVTMGLASIMKAKKILLLINGKSKKDIFKKLKNTEVTEEIPASILLNHDDVTVIVTNDAI